jgi:hypothetical protein
VAIVTTSVHDVIVVTSGVVVAHYVVAIEAVIPTAIATTANSWIFVFIIPVISRRRR